MLIHWLKESFKDVDSARNLIAMICGVMGVLAFAVFAIAYAVL